MKTKRSKRGRCGSSNESTIAVRQLVRPDDGSLTRFSRGRTVDLRKIFGSILWLPGFSRERVKSPRLLGMPAVNGSSNKRSRR